MVSVDSSWLEYKLTGKDVSINILGRPGRVISGAPELYLRTHPDDLVVLNAYVCTCHEKIWHGDLNISKDYRILSKLSKEVGQDVFILKEYRPSLATFLQLDVSKYIVKFLFSRFGIEYEIGTEYRDRVTKDFKFNKARLME